MLNRIKFFINRFFSKLGLFRGIVCIGDSHSMVYDYINSNILFSGYFFETKIVHGATASGIQNPNSKTQARLQFDYFVQGLHSKQPILIQLGEVDCGFVIWYRSEKLGISIEEQLEFTLLAYKEFIKSIREKFSTIIIMSAVLPTIRDGQDFGEIANLRKEVRASLKKRTELTLKFNLEVKQFCLENELFFMDLDTMLLDCKTNLVHEKFLNEDPLDHHLSNHKLSKIIIENLNKINF